jgi:lipid A 3-O-deacylase
MKRRGISQAALSLGLCAVAHAASAACLKPDYPIEQYGTFSLVVENDLFANTDRGYTSGQRLTWVTPPVPLDRGIVGWLRQFPPFAGWCMVRTEYSLNQAIFTPSDITRSNPDPRDRPYAGWLEGSFGVIGERGDFLDQLAVGIGVVGPASLGKESQDLIHIIRSFDRAQGWAFQLRNEPTVQLRYQQSWRPEWLYREQRRKNGLGVDAIAHYGVSVGNAYTYGHAGATVRFGEDLKDDYGPPRVSPSVPGSTFFEPHDSFGWYLFASAEGRVVARNMFLEGNTFQDSRGVSAYPLVADLQAGAVVIFKNVRLSYTHVWRTKEFQFDRPGDQFGVFTMSLRW